MAELNLFANNLEKELICSICHDIFTNPRTLKCLHSFCFDCICSWNESCKRERRPLTCPSCNSIERLEDNEVTKLPSSFYLDSLLQLLLDMKDVSNAQSNQELPDCVCCKKQAKLVAVCPQCRGIICDACVNLHQTHTPFEEHHCTLFADLKKENVNIYIKNRMYCKERYHNNNKLDFYCTTCKQCICFACNQTEHKPHHTVTIEEAAEEVKVVIRRDMDRVNKVKNNHERELELCKQNMNRIEQETTAAINQVTEEIEQHIKLLQEHKTAIIETLQEKLQQQRERNDEEQREIRDGIARINEYSLQGQTLLDGNVAHFIITGQHDLSQRSETFLQMTPVLCTKSVERNASVRYKPNPQVTQCLQNIGVVEESVTDPASCSIENLQDVRCGFVNRFEVVTRNSQNEVCVTDEGSIDVQIQDGNGNKVEKEVDRMKTGKFRVKYKAEKPCDYTINVRINGQKVKNSPQTIKTLDCREEFKHMRTVFGEKSGIRYFSKPTSVGVGKSGQIAIVDGDNHQVVIFTVDGEFLRFIGERGTGNGQLMNPFSVLFNGDRLLVIDNYDDTGRLLEFDLNGDYHRTIYKEKGIELRGMCTTEEAIAVCFEDKRHAGNFSGGLKMFNKHSGQLMKEMCCVHEDNVPLYVAYDDDNFLLLYPSECCVRVFNRNGVLLCKFGKRGKGGGQFDGPRGLTVINDSILLICDMENHRVQMLTLDGRFIRSFGSGLGEMLFPNDIDVTQYGQVLVCNLRSSCIQVWR